MFGCKTYEMTTKTPKALENSITLVKLSGLIKSNLQVI